LSFSDLQFTNAGQYSVLVSNPAGWVTSSTAVLTVVPAPDTNAPTVSAIVPANGNTGVAINQTISATFSEAMDPATIGATSFLLTGPGETVVAGVVNYDVASQTATFTPAGDLAPNTIYKATLTTGATDLAGNALAAELGWSFTAGSLPDTTAPSVSATVPPNLATGVAIGSQIAGTFSEAMDASTISTPTFTLKQGTTPVSGTVSYSGVTATFTPAGNLAPLTTFTATISTGARDLAGNALAADVVWSFTTGVIPDTTPPTVSAIVPADANTSVAIDQTITAT